MAMTLVEFWDEVRDAVFSLRYDSTNAIESQSFVLNNYDGILDSVQLRLKKIGSPTGNMWVEIHSSRSGTSATKDASTNIVGEASDDQSIASMTTSWANYTFSFSGTKPEISAGSTYYIVIYADSSISTSNYIQGRNSSGNNYADGKAWKISTGLEWDDAAAYDFDFKVIGSYLFDESVSASDSLTEAMAITETLTESVSTDDAPVSHSQSIQTNYAYYLLSDDGKVYQYSAGYKGDAGESITKQLITKNTDFTDQGTPSDLWKTVYSAKLFYLDLDSSTNVTLYISTNDGTTWTTTPTGTKSLGTGSGEVKTATYHFAGGKTGQFFKFKIESGSSSTRIQWLGLEVEYEERGPHFNI